MIPTLAAESVFLVWLLSGSGAYYARPTERAQEPRPGKQANWLNAPPTPSRPSGFVAIQAVDLPANRYKQRLPRPPTASVFAPPSLRHVQNEIAHAWAVDGLPWNMPKRLRQHLELASCATIGIECPAVELGQVSRSKKVLKPDGRRGHETLTTRPHAPNCDFLFGA